MLTNYKDYVIGSEKDKVLVADQTSQSTIKIPGTISPQKQLPKKRQRVSSQAGEGVRKKLKVAEEPKSSGGAAKKSKDKAQAVSKSTDGEKEGEAEAGEKAVQEKEEATQGEDAVQVEEEEQKEQVEQEEEEEEEEEDEEEEDEEDEEDDDAEEADEAEEGEEDSPKVNEAEELVGYGGVVDLGSQSEMDEDDSEDVDYEEYLQEKGVKSKKVKAKVSQEEVDPFFLEDSRPPKKRNNQDEVSEVIRGILLTPEYEEKEG